jgi:hypothetical protein
MARPVTGEPYMITESLSSLGLAGAVGVLAGTHAAIWGMYKDAVHEGFSVGRFTRSMILGAVAAVVLQLLLRLPLPGPAAVVVLFGLAYAAERTMVELWKTFIRQEDQSKYFIPMQFSIGGVPLANRSARLAIGVGCAAALAGSLALIAKSQQAMGTLPRPIQGMLIGLAIGTLIAIGGCWKDAPKEGFDPIKLFRSPAVSMLCALVLCWLSDNSLHIAVAAMGFERASVETYKTFITSKPPGKFFGKPILYPQMLHHRRRFVPMYIAISTAVFVYATVATGFQLLVS